MHRLYLVKGARATTAIEGNTLSVEQIKDQLEGRLELPRSQEYLRQEVANVLKAVNEIFAEVIGGQPPGLTPEWIARANRRLLAGLEEHLEEGVVPGEVPTHSVGVGRYRGAPREDCAFLLQRLCGWLEGDDWPVRPDQREDRTASAILHAVFVHLYIAWIHPFGDGNGRTARLAEFMILAREACRHPAPIFSAITTTSPGPNTTGSSIAPAGRTPVAGTRWVSCTTPCRVSLTGCGSKADTSRGSSCSWPGSTSCTGHSDGHRRHRPCAGAGRLTLALGRAGVPIRKQAIPDLSPDLARLYAAKTGKTLARDMNWLVKHHFLERGEDGYRAKVELMRAFRPAQA